MDANEELLFLRQLGPHAPMTARPRTPLLSPRTAAERQRTPSLVDVDLDPAQQAAVALPDERALLVLGEAGHGKTTVLLHRVARLWHAAGSKRDGVIVVPTEGLVRLIRPVLRRMGVDIGMMSFDAFANKQARRAFRRLPRESESTPPSVMRIKRSPALRVALDEIASRRPGTIDDDADAPVRARKTSASVARGDLQHLFGDRVLMERVAQAGSLPAFVVDDVLDRTRVQFSATTERAWSHVTDRKRLIAVDGRPLDEGTATEDATTVDVEDYAVLFELDRMRARLSGAEPKAPRTFDLVAIDEAQELAPLELALLGRSLAPGGALIVSGDADQHTDETSTFQGWDSVMRDLGAVDHATATLEIGYRCPPEIVAIARSVRDATGAASAHTHVFADERVMATALGRDMAAVLARDRRASIAVICRHPLTARRLAPLLLKEVPTRLVFDGRFLARGPVQVSIVSETKGLEFDYVVVPDANAATWPDDAASRRAMYVAVTRARHQVVFACAQGGGRAPLLG
jgi:DNA helicase II / ATP-dependent DNA helicase PcrA